jgi:hypothetical protein
MAEMELIGMMATWRGNTKRRTKSSHNWTIDMRITILGHSKGEKVPIYPQQIKNNLKN